MKGNRNMLKNLHLLLNKLTPFQVIVAYYLVAITVSTILLSLPGALQPGVKWSFIDAVFTAVSAISVTGLTTINISETFSLQGIFLLMFVLQFGGVGIMTLGTFFWILVGKKIGLKERKLMMADQNQTTLAGVVNLLKQILLIIVGIELVGAIILGVHFLDYFPSWDEAFLHGLFTSVSATTNAGFDITGNSLKPFADDYFVQFITIILITLGAIGFPVLIEVKNFLLHRSSDLRFRFTLYTKLTTVTFFILFVLGTILILLLEFNHFFQDKTWHESFFYALFHSATTKSAGLTTMNVSEFTVPTLLVICVLMFIGASPSSVGGGIRTTTLALNVLFLYAFARGRKSIKVFRREIHEDDLTRSLAVTLMAIIICSTSVIVLSISEPHASLLAIIFEVCSAFGTTGLSMGITGDLSTFGKIVIILIMFIGRIGILAFLFMIGGRSDNVKYHYPKERVIIG